MHIGSTPGIKFKFLALVLATVFNASAQTDLSTYQGPGILSPGIGNIGNRSGEQVNLRVWGAVSGSYDTIIQPVSTDSKGSNLLDSPESGTILVGVTGWLILLCAVVMIVSYQVHLGCFKGSAQEFDGTRILGCFPEDDEFGSGCGHALRFEQ